MYWSVGSLFGLKGLQAGRQGGGVIRANQLAGPSKHHPFSHPGALTGMPFHC